MVRGVLTRVIATYADKVFSDCSNGAFAPASQLRNARLPLFLIQSFGVQFKPRCIVGAGLLDQ
jgi:hypothetical protein